MKIAIVTKNMLNGGAERVIHNLICEWCRFGEVEVNLIILNDKQEIFFDIPKECNTTVIISNKKNRVLEKLDRYKKMKKRLREIEPDIVLSMPEEVGIYVLLTMKGTKIPVVVSERNNPRVMPYKKVTRCLRKLLYPGAAGLIFQTKQAESFFSEKLQKKGIVLPNPLNLDNIPDAYVGEREKVIVGAGRLERQKNFPLLIDAFTEFYKSHPDYKLVIYGEGSLRGELANYAKEKNLPAGVITLPGRSTKLIEEIRTKAMFVLSSDFEGMPNVVIEAMSVGTPTISTDCPAGGSAELIVDGENGLLIPVGDKEAMATAMARLADDRELSEKFSKNSVAVKERLDSRVVAKNWLEYLASRAKRR